ncbi:hypothetical protein [Tsuneonella sp. HG222]
MIPRMLGLLAATTFLAACDQPGPPDPPPVTPQTKAAVGGLAEPTESAVVVDARVRPSAVDRQTPLVAEAVILAEWAKAANRESCAPLAFEGTGSARGAPRSAEFSGGWAVAFDLPNLRSAFGVAGTGVRGTDAGPTEAERAALTEQWPYFRELENVPKPAFAAYGVEGAEPYPATNATGRGLNSLAYVRIGGQNCLYNVWSRLGRAHLETLLGELRVVTAEGTAP